MKKQKWIEIVMIVWSTLAFAIGGILVLYYFYYTGIGDSEYLFKLPFNTFKNILEVFILLFCMTGSLTIFYLVPIFIIDKIKEKRLRQNQKKESV